MMPSFIKPVRLFRSNDVLSAVAVLVLLTSLAACATGQYGRLQRDAGVTRMFETNSVPGDFRYYTIGRTNLPYAIVGIDPRYRLVTDYWDTVAPNTERFAQKVDFVWRPEIWERYTDGQGAWILDADGNRIGIWYSMYPYTTIRVWPDRRVDIHSPDYRGDGAAVDMTDQGGT